jgi:biotin carboxyl carrier protein
LRLQAPMNGEVVRILLEEGDPVAYDQDIFELIPSMASSGSRIK